MNLFQKLEEIRVKIADRRYCKRVFRQSMKAMTFPYKLQAIQALRDFAKASAAEEAAAKAPKEEEITADAWEDSPERAYFPNLYAEIALRVCGEPKDYARAAGVTLNNLHSAVYGGWDDLTEQQKEALARWVERMSGEMITRDYLFAPSFSVYYTANRKHRHKLQRAWAWFDRTKALLEKCGDDTRVEALNRVGRYLDRNSFLNKIWVSRAYYNKLVLNLEAFSRVLAVNMATKGDLMELL